MCYEQWVPFNNKLLQSKETQAIVQKLQLHAGFGFEKPLSHSPALNSRRGLRWFRSYVGSIDTQGKYDLVRAKKNGLGCS